MAIKRLTKRWLFNSFGVILVIILVLIIGGAFGIRGYYYNTVRQSVMVQANYVDSLMIRYSQDGSADFSVQIRTLVEDFAGRDSMELMAIGLDGEVLITSSGFEPPADQPMPDYESAMSEGSNDRYGEYIGELNGENVLAITMMSSVSSNQLSAMRFVVSLTQVDQQVLTLIILITIIGVSILFFVIMSSSYFINSIINPIGQIGDTARLIAQGDFDARLEKSNDDEIGDLCDTINNMAEELSATDRMKNDFISSVSHELRTPLTAIKGWAETMQEGGDLDESTRRKGIHVILSETERLSSMVEELLDFSRIQSGRFNSQLEKLDVVAELSDAVLMFDERARREGITLLYEEPEEFVVLMGDRNRLRQVFVNVIDNALKYSSAGGTVRVEAARAGSSFQVVVSDTGCGISAEDLPKVKTKFYKANFTRRGSGIGLAVANEIVQQHNGSLELASQVGKGTVVTITLPIQGES